MMAQGVSTLVSALVMRLADVLARALSQKLSSDAWLETVCHHGVLICFQSLVSTGELQHCGCGCGCGCGWGGAMLDEVRV